MSDHDHEEFEELASLYALGALDVEGVQRFENHLVSGCEVCATQRPRLVRVTEALARMTPPVEPSAGTSERIKQIVRADRRGDASPRQAVGDRRSVPTVAGMPGRELTAELGKLLGRDREMAVINHRLALLTEGEGSVITVEGDAGLGKTRLAREAAARAASMGATVWTGRAVTVERTSSYAPFDDLFRAWAGIDEDTNDRERAERLEATLRQYIGDDCDAIVAAIARVMRIESVPEVATPARLDGRALERIIQRRVCELFARLSSRGPILFVLDDLQWADESTLALLLALLPLIERHPLMLLILARPEQGARLATVADRADVQSRLRHDRVALKPMEDRHILSLARGLLGTDEIPEALARVVRTTAEGNPFYVEEVVRSIEQSGDADRQHGRLVVTTDLDRFQSLQGVAPVIQSRVAQLPEAVRLVLETASVIGRRFQVSVLSRMLDAPQDLTDALTLLDRMRFIVPAESRETASARVHLLRREAIYAFQHAFIRETLLDSVPEERQRSLHARCAAAIEDLFEQRLQDHYGLLAYHYSRAGVADRALEYLLLAGEIAATSAASADALHFFREAYAAYHQEQPVDRATEARLERNIALALLNTGNLTESIAHFNAALRSHGEWVPESRLLASGKALVDGAVVLTRLYTNSLARARRPTGERARAVFELMYNRSRAQNVVDDDRRAFGNLAAIRRLGRLNPASVENSTGMLAAAGAFFAFSGLSFGPSHRFLALAADGLPSGGDKARFLYKSMAFVVHFLEGDWSPEHEICEPLLDVGLRHGLLWDADVYLGMLCERHIYQGDFETAAALMSRFGSLRRDWGYEFAHSNQLATMAFLRFAERRLEDARTAVQEWYDQRAEPSLRLLALGVRSRIEILDGDCETAASTLEQADRVIAHGGATFPYYGGIVRTARLALAVARLERLAEQGERATRANIQAARRASRHALKSAKYCARDRAETLRLAGRLQWILRDHTAAFAYWRQAQAECGRLGARAELARVWADLGHALAAIGEDPARFGLEPRDYSALARQAFTQLGCTWELERLERARRRPWRAA